LTRGGINDILKKVNYEGRVPPLMKVLLKPRYSLIIATLCLILCILAVIFFSIDEVKQREIYYDYSATVDSCGLYLEGYERNGDITECKSDSGYIYLPVTDKKINDVKIVFDGKYSKDTDIKLEYVCKNSVQNGENYVTSHIDSGDREIYFSLDEDTYTVLRCHIPGSFKIKEIVLTHITSQNIVTKIEVNVLLLVVGLTVSVALYSGFVAIYTLKKKNK
jgi:hypothetical protein